MQALILHFGEASAQDAARTGGKGANLARLTQAGLPVPRGLVLSAAAYELFAASAGHLLRDASGFALHDDAALQAQCGVLVDRLERLPIPAEVDKAVRDGLAAHGLTTCPLSIRSSSTTEDMGGAAFAGQHETYLNVRGIEDVLAHIKKCWASLWAGRAVVYRNAAGFDLQRTSMAVVLQKMAFCDVAGVGFCIDPITGDMKRQTIDANFGLGESVVSGEAATDYFVVEKATGKVLESRIADKSMKIVVAELGTQEVHVTGAEAAQPALREAQIAELSALMRKVESLYGFPQDIEWGFEGENLWLLQSRPVTRIHPRYTREESAERFPSVITPLAWDLVEEGFHRSLNHSFALMGLPPFSGKWFAMFDNYIYGNQNAVEVYANGVAAGLKIGSVPELVAALPRLRDQYRWVMDLPLAWSRDLDFYLIRLGELNAEPLTGRTVVELWDYVIRVKELGADYFLPNIAISITQRTLYRILHGIIAMAVGPQSAQAVFDKMLAYCETKTGVINKELHALAQRIAARPELAERMAATESRAFIDDGGFAGYPDIEKIFSKFLRDHGHREVEFDPYHPTWVEAPHLVVDNLKVMLDAHHHSPHDQERDLKIEMRETEAALISRMPAELRFAAHEIVRLARAYTTLDDVEHYQTTRLTLPFRRGLKALGRKLLDIGVITDVMDVFFADAASLDRAVRGSDLDEWVKLRETIRANKEAYLRNRTRTPDWILGQAEDQIPAGSVDALVGLPGSPGAASAPVFKVYSADDFAAFPKGAVLVARTTNPAWTPLFYRASAVITESGGPLSHGAVTAREIGLPAVMSVKNALGVLENGQVVSVDGSAGRVGLHAGQPLKSDT